MNLQLFIDAIKGHSSFYNYNYFDDDDYIFLLS
jgi:hypothetical protein